MRTSLLLAAVFAPLVAIAGSAAPDIRQVLQVAPGSPLTDSGILASLVQLTPVGTSYIQVARQLMGRHLAHPSWSNPVDPKPERACAFAEHPIDCTFDGWTVSYAFDPTNTLTQVCVRASDAAAKPVCTSK